MLASGGGRTKKQEMWSRMRSWSVNDCLLPSTLTQQRRGKAVGAVHGRRLDGLDLAGVKVGHKRTQSPRPPAPNGGTSSTPEPRRPARLSLPAACYVRAGGSPAGQGTAEQSVARRQRHSVAGWRPHHLTKTGSGAACVFSTAVISGAASAPNLTDIIPNTASVSEGCGGVPPIRPLETLHNALSLRQIDTFLERMARGFKTPASTPPRQPGGSRPTSPTDSVTGISGWSDPPSFVSSSGASSPTPLPEFFLAQRLQQSGLDVYGHRDSIEVAELYCHAVGYSAYPPSFQPISNEGCEDDGYFYDDSESDLHETESTVVPSEDQTRARLSDIAWPREGEDDTPPAVPRSSGRFTCTSVDEEAQLVTPSSATVAVGFPIVGAPCHALEPDIPSSTAGIPCAVPEPDRPSSGGAPCQASEPDSPSTAGVPCPVPEPDRPSTGGAPCQASEPDSPSTAGIPCPTSEPDMPSSTSEAPPTEASH